MPHPAAKAGIKAKDVILGLEGKTMQMTMLQFNVYIRLNYEIGDRVTYAVPGGPLEPVLHRLLVGPDLRRIFEHRRRAVRGLLCG